MRESPGNYRKHCFRDLTEENLKKRTGPATNRGKQEPRGREGGRLRGAGPLERSVKSRGKLKREKNLTREKTTSGFEREKQQRGGKERDDKARLKATVSEAFLKKKNSKKSSYHQEGN